LFVSNLIIEARISAIIISISTFFFFSYGRVLDYFIKNPVEIIDLARNKFFLPIFLFCLIITWFLIIKSYFIKNYADSITTYANQFSIGLVFIAIFTTCLNYDWTLLFSQKNQDEKSEIYVDMQTLDKLNYQGISPKPNIYFLIFDSYPSSNVLNNYYAFNDSNLVNDLKIRGFDVNQNARSNYCFTGGSIGSTLSMRYLHLDNEFKSSYNQDSYIDRFYENNYVINRLKSDGYDIITNLSKKYNNNKIKKSLFSDDFIQLVIHLSMFRIIEKDLVVNQLRNDIQSKLKFLKSFIPNNQPVFINIHIMVPHSPFVFRYDGSRPKYFESAFGKFEDKAKFIEQVRFAGREIIKIVDNIKFNDPDAIIIVQADHGYGGEDDMKYLNRNSIAAIENKRDQVPPSDYLDQRFGILSAIYSPIDLGIKKNSTPVNLFRFIFNKLYEENNEYLPDNSYFALIKQPYKFHNITDSLNNISRQLAD